MSHEPPTIGLTMGDPAGVGPEILARALAQPEMSGRLRPLVVGDARVMERAIAGCGLELDVRRVRDLDDLRASAGLVEIVDLDDVGDVRLGEVDAACGLAAGHAIEHACALVRAGRLDGIVTGPLSKEALRAAGWDFPGHTEMLAALLEVPVEDVLTMFTLGRLRVFFVTRHLGLRDAIDQLSVQGVEQRLRRADVLMRELGYHEPRLALAALNPHAGEHGLMGVEEQEILEPALIRARAAGVHVVGPVPADAVFWQGRQGIHDAVLSLYHDQGHVAVKTVSFFGVVSATLGLPVIRTAAEHGTAFDIAGRWCADPAGQIAAMRAAAELAPGVLRARGREPASVRARAS